MWFSSPLDGSGAVDRYLTTVNDGSVTGDVEIPFRFDACMITVSMSLIWTRTDRMTHHDPH
jgi:hypothetical protein